ncbi:hypothetical protein ABC347_01610 [Sphingomonas sp. 1P06PA]|uniref:hypothetical protein n=1 Tax=Sphingomonas sp. 1P06PA TaxID=554121 RepID=UPI0039A60B44
MSGPVTIIERAFELAREGQLKDASAIAKVLSREGHQGAEQHLNGGAIRKQLAAILRASRTDGAAPAQSPAQQG